MINLKRLTQWFKMFCSPPERIVANKLDTIDKANSERAIAWIEKKWVKDSCEVCGNSNWALADVVGKINSTPIGTNYLPVLMLTCNNCGNTKLFSASHAGCFASTTDAV